MNDEQIREKFIDVCINRNAEIQSQKGTSKNANRYFDIKTDLIKQVKDAGNIKAFVPLLDSDNIIVQYNAAVALINYKPVQLRCKILERISQQRGLCAFEAMMFLREWQKGNIK